MSAAVDLAPIVAGSAVLIHCTLGVNRAATITIGIVVQRLGITVPAAVALVKSKRDVRVKQKASDKKEKKTCQIVVSTERRQPLNCCMPVH